MTMFPEGTNFMAKVKTKGFQCQEMIEGKPWTYQIDYFGLLATIYILLKGEYPQWKRQPLGKAVFPPIGAGSGTLRSFKHIPTWKAFHETLIGIVDCDSIPSLAPLIRRVKKTLENEIDNYTKRYSSHVEVLKKGGL